MVNQTRYRYKTRWCAGKCTPYSNKMNYCVKEALQLNEVRKEDEKIDHFKLK